MEWLRLETQLNTLTDFEVAFLNQFQPHDYENRLALQVLNHRHDRNGSITYFIRRLRSIYSKIKPPPSLKTQIDIACNNLIPHFIYRVKRREINSFEDLIALGQDKAKRCREFKRKEGISPTAVVSCLTDAVSDPIPNKKRKQSSESAKSRISSSNFSSPVETSKAGSKQPLPSGDLPKPEQYYKCQKMGHSWKDCQHNGHKFFCYKCGKSNVMKFKCPNCAGVTKKVERDQYSGKGSWTAEHDQMFHKIKKTFDLSAAPDQTGLFEGISTPM